MFRLRYINYIMQNTNCQYVLLFFVFHKKQQTEKPWTTLGAGVSEPIKVLQTVKISDRDSLLQKSPSPIHLAAIPQFSRKFLTNCVQSRENPQKSAFFRCDAGRYGTPSHLLEISLGLTHVGSNPTVSAKRLSVVIITADFFFTFSALLTDVMFHLFTQFV